MLNNVMFSFSVALHQNSLLLNGYFQGSYCFPIEKDSWKVLAKFKKQINVCKIWGFHSCDYE
jgi:hypothetical protein